MCAAREAEAEALYRAGLAKAVGRGAKVRCLMLTVPIGRAWGFLRGGRANSNQPSKTFHVERVGAQRSPVYAHLQRSFGFGGTDSLPIVTQPAVVEPSGSNGRGNTEPEPADDCEHLLAVDNSCQQAETKIAVDPERKEEVEEKEEKVVVEPTTPDVVIVTEQPQDNTTPLSQEEISLYSSRHASPMRSEIGGRRDSSKPSRFSWIEPT